jgi:hypothetical protein
MALKAPPFVYVPFKPGQSAHRAEYCAGQGLFTHGLPEKRHIHHDAALNVLLAVLFSDKERLNFLSILVLCRLPLPRTHLGGGLSLPLVGNAFQAFVHEFQVGNCPRHHAD